MAQLWLIVFSLAPCTIKAAWLSAVSTFSTRSAVDIDYSKPLNQSRTTAGQQCQFTNAEHSMVRVVKKIKLNRQPAVRGLSVKNHCRTAAAIDTRNPKGFSGSSPPRYILYKRLKLDVA